VVVFLDGTLVVVLSAAFILGLVHSFEPDHVVAVSTIVAQSKGLTLIQNASNANRIR
jgi:high-affinity nickel permease